MCHQTSPMMIERLQCRFNLGNSGRGRHFKNFVIGCHIQFLVNELPARHLWQKLAGDESTNRSHYLFPDNGADRICLACCSNSAICICSCAILCFAAGLATSISPRKFDTMAIRNIEPVNKTTNTRIESYITVNFQLKYARHTKSPTSMKFMNLLRVFINPSSLSYIPLKSL